MYCPICDSHLCNHMTSLVTTDCGVSDFSAGKEVFDAIHRNAQTLYEKSLREQREAEKLEECRNRFYEQIQLATKGVSSLYETGLPIPTTPMPIIRGSANQILVSDSASAAAESWKNYFGATNPKPKLLLLTRSRQ